MSEIITPEVATESLLNTNVDKSLAQFKKYVDKKCKTAEDCAAAKAKLKTDADNFNKAMSCFKKVGEEVKSGKLSPKEAKKQIKECAKDLKKQMELLHLKKVDAKEMADDAKSITDEEVACLRKTISGMIQILSDKSKELSGAGAAKESATENVADTDSNTEDTDVTNNNLDPITMPEDSDVATEGTNWQIGKQIRVLNKELRKTIKECKGYKKSGQFDKAIACARHAQQVVKQAKAEISKLPDTGISDFIGNFFGPYAYLVADHAALYAQDKEHQKTRNFNKKWAILECDRLVTYYDQEIKKFEAAKKNAVVKESFIGEFMEELDHAEVLESMGIESLEKALESASDEVYPVNDEDTEDEEDDED